MSKMHEPNNRTITIERVFNAPLKLVWEAWTSAEHIAQWWGPKGMAIEIIEHDFQPGGNWKYVMPMPDGNQFISEGKYLDIVDQEKIITTANFRPMTEGIEIHISFEEKGDSTKFIFSCVHPTEEYCKQQEKMGIYNGWGSAFDRLENHLSTSK